LLGITACASWYMKGSRAAKGLPQKSLGSFTIPKCKTSTGQETAGPQATYYIAVGTHGGIALFEMDAAGNGTEITNHWQDSEGHHFVTYVASSHGWHYVVPDEPGKPGTRYVHTAGTYSVSNEGNVMKLNGPPAATCEMVPEGQSPTTAPPPSASSSTPAPPPTATPDAGATPPPPGSTTPPPPSGTGAPLLPGQVCSPGATQECFGIGACKGGQRCREDGTGWGSCDCGKK
jgi:hypothetical protein